MEERETLFRVNNMTCPACARRVDRALRAVDGVHDVKVQLSDGTVRVRYTDATEEELGEALAVAGYPLAA